MAASTMANKQTIQDVDAALDRWHRKLTTAVRKIDVAPLKTSLANAGQPTSELSKCAAGRSASDLNDCLKFKQAYVLVPWGA